MRACVAYKQAIETGAKKYSTGKSCPHDHPAERYTATRDCVTCSLLKAKENPVANRAAKKKHYCKDIHTSRSKQNEVHRVLYATDPVFRAKALAQTPNPEVRSRASKKYNAANPEKRLALAAKHRGLRRQATPPWFNSDHTSAVERLFILAARLLLETGLPHEVDHIVPIAGKTVCGLHVPWNLQVIPANDNRRKSNKWAA